MASLELLDTLRRIRLRIRQTEDELQASVTDLGETWELFGDEPDPEQVTT